MAPALLCLLSTISLVVALPTDVFKVSQHTHSIAEQATLSTISDSKSDQIHDLDDISLWQKAGDRTTAAILESDETPPSKDSYLQTRQDFHFNRTSPNTTTDTTTYPDPCRDPGLPWDPTCWDKLNVTGYLYAWNASTPRCSVDTDPHMCCGPATEPNETWSSCYLRLTLNNANTDCSNFTLGGCTGANVRDVPASSPYAAQARYVVRAIWASNQLFATWYDAANDALIQILAMIPAMVQLLDPIKHVRVSLNLALAIIMVGFSMAAGSEFFAFARIASEKAKEAEAAAKTAASAAAAGKGAAGAAANAEQKARFVPGKWSFAANGIILTTLIDAPFLARAIWPEYTADSQFYQASDMMETMRQVQKNLLTRFDMGNRVIMRDFGTFANVTRNGSFTVAQMPDFAGVVNTLTEDFGTWVMTYALAKNNYMGWWGPNMTDGLLPTAQSAADHFGCTVQPGNQTCANVKKGGKYGTGKGWAVYASPSTLNFFSLVKKASNSGMPDRSEPYSAQIFNQSISSQWTTMARIFDDSYACKLKDTTAAFRHPDNQTVANPEIDHTRADFSRNNLDDIVDLRPDGSFGLACVNRLPLAPGCDTTSTWARVDAMPSKCMMFWG